MPLHAHLYSRNCCLCFVATACMRHMYHFLCLHFQSYNCYKQQGSCCYHFNDPVLQKDEYICNIWQVFLFVLLFHSWVPGLTFWLLNSNLSPIMDKVPLAVYCSLRKIVRPVTKKLLKFYEFWFNSWIAGPHIVKTSDSLYLLALFK